MITPAEVEQVMDWLIPVPCGIPLLRYGGEADGGYLVPDDLAGVRAVFSPGANNVKSFEDQLALRHGIASHICDFNSEPENFQTPLIEGLQFFDRKWLDVPPAPDSLDINDWVQSRCPGNDDLILQMDIEGAEYRNLLHATDETLQRFRIIVIELHSLGKLSNRAFVERWLLPVVTRLSRHFVCIHAHPNNCCGSVSLSDSLIVPQVMELTLLRRDRLRPTQDKITLPHPLDRANVPNKPPLVLSGPWLRHADPEKSHHAQMEQRLSWLEAAVMRHAQGASGRVTSAELNPSLYQSFIAGRENLARGKPSDQSSHDPTGSASNSGASDKPTHDGGIQTMVEANPWWAVDLQAVARIGAICIFGGSERTAARMQQFAVSVSDDALKWTPVYTHRGRSPFAEHAATPALPNVMVPLLDVPARYVRLSMVGNARLKADKIEIWGRPDSDEA